MSITTKQMQSLGHKLVKALLFSRGCSACILILQPHSPGKQDACNHTVHTPLLSGHCQPHCAGGFWLLQMHAFGKLGGWWAADKHSFHWPAEAQGQPFPLDTKPLETRICQFLLLVEQVVLFVLWYPRSPSFCPAFSPGMSSIFHGQPRRREQTLTPSVQRADSHIRLFLCNEENKQTKSPPSIRAHVEKS